MMVNQWLVMVFMMVDGSLLLETVTKDSLTIVNNG